jgi:hypothetical protein
MVRLLLISCLFLNAGISPAQNLESERFSAKNKQWMELGRAYYILPIVEKGIYRISAGALMNKGFPDMQDTLHFQYELFCLGEAVPFFLYVDPDDKTAAYLEFYAEGDEGKSDDLLLQEDSASRLNPFFSLFTDTAYYFLSWHHKRFEGPIQVKKKDALLMKKSELGVVQLQEQVIYKDQHAKVFQKWAGIDWAPSTFEMEGFASDWYNTLITEIAAPGIASYKKQIPGPQRLPATLTVHLMSNHYEEPHQLQFFVNDRFIGADTFSFSKIKSYEFSIPVEYLSANNSVMVKATNGEYDKFAIGCVLLTYPSMELGNASIFAIPRRESGFPLRIQTKEKLENLVVWDFQLREVGYTQTDAAGFLFLSSPGGNPGGRYFVQAEKKIKWIQLPPESFTPVPLPPMDIDVLLITNQSLTVDKNGENPVLAYLEYRKSNAGGKYNPWLSDIKNLEKQYAYGIPNHPLAIRGFINRLIQENYSLKAVLLLGKGREYRDIRRKELAHHQIEDGSQSSLLPTWGYPGSDAMLVSSFKDDLPWTSFGRIPAISGDEIRLYLNKVLLFEERRDSKSAWMKRVIQLGGGTYEPEKKYIREVLEHFAVFMDKLPWSPGTVSIFKENDAPVFIPYSRQFFDAVNAGIALIIFFGHSTANTFDFNIDHPGFYENGFKQPFFLSLGCYAGNHFTSFRSQGERFLFYPESGAIGFAATRGVGFLHSLAEMGRAILGQMKGEAEFPSWGRIMHKGILSLWNREPKPLRAMAQQLTFQGDPLVRLPIPNFPKPDFMPQSVRVTPFPFLAGHDSILLAWELLHLGIEPLSSLFVALRLEGSENILFEGDIIGNSDGNKISIKCAFPKNLDKGSYRLWITYKKQGWIDGFGLQRFENLDVSYVHDDGIAGFPLQVENRLFIPLSPIDYGVLSEGNRFSLFRASADLSAQFIHLEWKGDKNQTPDKEINPIFFGDRVLHQTLPFKADSSVIQGVVPFTPNRDEVYYWRAYPEGTDEKLLKILPFQSFTYHHQSQFRLSLSSPKQFMGGTFEGIYPKDWEQNGSGWQFSTVYNTLIIRNKWNESENPPEFIHNGQPIGSPWPWLLPAAIQVMVWDTIEGNWIKNPPGGLYQSKSNGFSMNAWVFDTQNETGRLGLMTFLEQGIPHGAYVSLYSAQEKGKGDYRPELWEDDALKYGKDLFSVLEGFGATKVRFLKERGAVPYMLHFRKGFGKLDESVAFRADDIIYSQCNPSKVWHRGTYTSPLLGPALKWQELHLEFEDKGTIHDTLDIEISAFDPSFPLFKPVLFEKRQLTPEHLPRVLRANEFFLNEMDRTLAVKLGIPEGRLNQVSWPFLQVKLHISNRFNKIPLKIKKIQAVFQPLPEIKTSLKTSVSEDSIFQNGHFSAFWRLENLSSFATDSLFLSCKIISRNGVLPSQTQVFRPLKPFEVVDIPWQWSLDGMEGEVDIAWQWGLPGDDFFPANNKGIYKGLKIPDKIKRSFSVLIDGEPMQEGAYVSQRPKWVIEALLSGQGIRGKGDTLTITASLWLPDGRQKPIVWKYEAAQITYEKQENERKVIIFWQPFFPMEGTYKIQLELDNYSEIREFQVIKPQKVSHLQNYPNPFTRVTRFHYTLSAGAPVTRYTLQIFSISGSLVRTLSHEQLGSLRVGTHLTEGGWDGRDSFGDSLANGVYIYQLSLLHQNITGKMVLLNP